MAGWSDDQHSDGDRYRQPGHHPRQQRRQQQRFELGLLCALQSTQISASWSFNPGNSGVASSHIKVPQSLRICLVDAVPMDDMDLTDEVVDGGGLGLLVVQGGAPSDGEGWVLQLP